MKTRAPFATLVLGIAAAMLASGPLAAQNVSVLASGLKAPSKVILTDHGDLLVAEAGDGPNTGRISIIDRAGTRRTLLDRLPAGPAAPFGDPDGPSGLALRANTLYISIGVGDATLQGEGDTEVPNPTPASPIFSSILELELGRPVEASAGDFVLTLADQATLKAGHPVTLAGGGGETASVRLIADFADYVPDPVFNVRASHPYGIALAGNLLYVVDAALNLVRKVNLTSGGFETVSEIPPLPNPLPFGPPVMDAVPDSIRVQGNRLLVPLLSGFPFPVGSAEIRSIAIDSGAQTTLIAGLASAIDVLPLASVDHAERFLVLQFSTDMLADAPGQLVLASGGEIEVVAAPLITPTSLAFDSVTGDAFVTQIFTGDLVTFNISDAVAPVGCSPNGTTLCLQGGRFRVTSTWRTMDGRTGPGHAAPYSDESGHFWFFSPANAELTTKVLGACAGPFDSYWFFAAGLTNVEVTLTVTDTLREETRTYANPLGTPFAPILDTAAFATCP